MEDALVKVEPETRAVPYRPDCLYERERMKKTLNTAIPPTAIKTKPTKGNYLSNGYVVAELNRIFNGQWHEEMISKTVEPMEGGIYAEVVLKVTIPGYGEHTDVGTAYKPPTRQSLGELRGFAIKTAWTDARKRAAKNFGEALGNQLYKK